MATTWLPLAMWLQNGQGRFLLHPQPSIPGLLSAPCLANQILASLLYNRADTQARSGLLNRKIGGKRPNQCGWSSVQTLSSMTQARNQKQKQEEAWGLVRPACLGTTALALPRSAHTQQGLSNFLSSMTNAAHPIAAKFPPNLEPVCSRPVCSRPHKPNGRTHPPVTQSCPGGDCLPPAPTDYTMWWDKHPPYVPSCLTVRVQKHDFQPKRCLRGRSMCQRQYVPANTQLSFVREGRWRRARGLLPLVPWGRTGYNCLPGTEHTTLRSAHGPPALWSCHQQGFTGGSKGLLPDLLRVLRPCHPGGDLGHVCATAGPKAHLFPTREPENGSVLMTALPSSSF